MTEVIYRFCVYCNQIRNRRSAMAKVLERQEQGELLVH